MRLRVMRIAVLLLISVVLAANCIWAMKAVAGWHHGLGEPARSEALLLKQLNSTTFSVEVSMLHFWSFCLPGTVSQPCICVHLRSA
jgi:hypothetical protein